MLSLISIFLIILSSFTHAGWNLLGKRENPSISYFFLGNTLGICVFLPILIVYFEKLKFIPPSVWILLVATGFFEAVYYSSLAYGYRTGEMTLVYPIARSLPVIIVTLVMLGIGKIEELSTLYIIGCFFIVIGLFIQPLKTINNETIKNMFNISSLFALLAAIGTAAYSIIDAKALKILKNISQNLFSSLEASLIYMVFLGLFSSLWLGIFTLLSKKERQVFPDIMANCKQSATLMGIGIYLTYGLVLISMLFVQNVGYVVAFRQLSIPVGTILGYVVLKESLYPLKVIGTTITLVGLIIVSFG